MLLKFCRLIFLVLILGILAALGAMQLKPVKEFVIAKGIDLYTRKMGQHLEVEDVDLLLPFEIKITHPRLLTLDGKKCFEASSVLIRINPYSLFSKDLHIHSLILVDPIFETNNENNAFSVQDLLSLFPVNSITVNHLRLIHYKIPDSLDDIITGVYDIDAKIEYDPQEGYAFLSGKATKSDNNIHCLQASIALFADENVGFIGFEVEKAKGIFSGPLSYLSGRLSGNFSGSYRDWEQFLLDPKEVTKYSIDGQIRSSWTFADPRTPLKGILTTSLELGKGTLVKINNFELKTPLFATGANFEVDRYGSLENASGSLKVEEVSKCLNQLNIPNEMNAKGPMAIHFQCSGPLDALKGKTEIFSNNGEIFGKQLEIFSGEIQFSQNHYDISGNARFNIKDHQQKFLSTLHFTTNFFSHLSLTNINFELPWGNGTGDFEWKESIGLKANINTHIKDASFAKAIVDQNIKGSLDTSISYSTLGGTPKFDMHLSSTELKLNDHTAKDLDLLLEGQGKLEEFSCFGKAFAKSITIKDEEFQNIDVLIDHSSTSTESPFHVNLTYHDEPFSLKGVGKVLLPNALQFQIDHFSGKFRNTPLLLEAPFEFTSDFASLHSSPIHLSFGKGSISSKVGMQEDFWRFSLNFQKVPCEIFPFEEFFDQYLEGDVEGEAILYGFADNLQGNVRFDIHDLFAKGDTEKNIPVLKGSVLALFENKLMECQGNILGINEAPIKFQCTLPVTLSLKDPFVTVDKEATINANIYAEGSLTPLLELFVPDAASFTAEGKINMRAYGSFMDPKFDGSFTLKNGLLEIYELGTIITDIQAELRGNGTSLELTRLHASDGANGIISGTGSLVLSKKDGFPFHFDMSLNNAKPAQVDIFEGVSSGTLTWHGTLDKSIVEGTLDIQSGKLHLPKKIPETSVSYPVHYINPDENNRKPTEIIAEIKLDIPIELKIQLATVDPLTIEDDNLNSAWHGKVNLQGNILKPQLQGELKLQSGDYILNGKRFVLSQGRVSYNGDFEKKSNVYVSLSREIGDYEVEIILKGLLKDPEILLQSHPPLPKQQVLSLILFGRTSAEISELQEEQLEQSLSNLTSSSSKKEGTLTKFQKSLGIDHIDLMRSNENSSEVRIRLSKYISRGICLSVSRDVGEDVNSLSLEAELQKNIKAQIEAQDNAQGQISIFWKKNY